MANLPILSGTFAHKSERPLCLCERFSLYERFSGTEREKEKEHGETIKGPLHEGPNSEENSK